MGNEDLIQFAINQNYTLDYLTSGSPIFQVEGLYTFTSDSIALAHAVKEEKFDVLIDLCAGSGVVGLEIADTKEVKKLYLVELQKELAFSASHSAKLSKSKTEIEVLNEDVKNLAMRYPNLKADIITINPPYFKKGSGELPENVSRAMARHELTLTLDDLIKTSSELLKRGGKLYFIHIASRQKEIEKVLSKHGFVVLNTQIISGKLSRVIYECSR